MKLLSARLGYTSISVVIALLTHNTQLAENTQFAQVEDEKLIITSPRALPNADGVSDELIQSLRTATSDTASLLKAVPGVSLQKGGGVSSIPVIQGMADDRLRIRVDGMDLISACANHMNPPLSYIDPSNVGSATVFAGITPVSIGGDSIGSTIIVDSSNPVFADDDNILTHGEAGISYRSNGGELSSNLAATIASKHFTASYHGSTVKAENYTAGGHFKSAGVAASGREWLDADEVGSSMYKSTNHALALGYQYNNHLLKLKLGSQDIPYQGWVNQRMDMTGNDSTQTNFGYEGQFDWGNFEGRIYSEETRHKMQFYKNKLFWYGPNMTAPDTDGSPCTPGMGMNGCAAGMPMDTRGDNKGLSLKASIELSNNAVLRIGSEVRKYQLDDWWEPSGKGMWPETFWNINNGQRDRLAFFSEWESNLNTQWLMQIGIRYEKVNMNADEVQGYNMMPMAQYGPESVAFNAANRKKSDDNIDLTTLARYQVDNERAIEFGYARKTRSPNLYERYTWSTGGMIMRMTNMTGDGNGYVGNHNLVPEIAHTISAKMEWNEQTQDKWELIISPYYTYVEDYIDTRRCVSDNMNCGMMNQTAENAFVYLQFVNQSAQMYGVDISGQVSILNNSQYGNFSARAMLSYIRGDNETTEDNLFNVMPLNAKLALNHNKNNWDNNIEIELVQGKTRTSQVRNELETSGYALLHLRGSYQWESVSINFGIENIFDRFYNHPLSGVYTGQGKTMSATGIPWGVAVPGKGRNLYVGINLVF